jgi:hypothetical protein
MLDEMPAELLLNILSYLDNLDPISHASHALSLSTRDFKTRTLRTRLANIKHIGLLMKIWTPPSFFKPREGSPACSKGSYITRPQDRLYDMLCDPYMVVKVEEYLDNLEKKARAAQKIAGHLLTMMSFDTDEEQHSYATKVVIELWSAQSRYGHDVDGRWSDINDECGLQEVHVRDNYVTDLPSDIQEAMITAYNALAQRLQPPFYSSSRRSHGGRIAEGEGMWLYRLIVKVSPFELQTR